MAVVRLILLSFILISVFSDKGFDLSSLASAQSFKCAYKSGYSFVVIRGSRSNGAVDSSMRSNVQQASRAGLSTDLYIYPCAGRNATEQAYSMINSLGLSIKFIKTIWIDIETHDSVSSNCHWNSYSPDTNCLFISELANAIDSKKINVGIYSNWQQWPNVFGSKTACSYFFKKNLWYAHYNGDESFAKFKQFGGWKTPFMKQHTQNVKLCNMEVDLIWKP